MAPARSNADTGSATRIAAAGPRASAPAEDERSKALREENEELRLNSQFRSLFLSRLAHELRTPLTSILGFAEILLSQEKLTDAQRGFCERIQSSGQQLQASLNQLSDLARLEGTPPSLSLERISVAEVLRDVVPTLARSLEKKRLRLSVTAPDDLPLFVSDRARVRLVAYNVVSYAISCSPEGATILTETAAIPERISIRVRYSGEPLADTSRIGLLDADDTSNTNELGLSIAYQNVKILGGEICARNLEGEVEFRIDLPGSFAAPEENKSPYFT